MIERPEIASLFTIGLPGLTLDDETKRALDTGIGGVILFARNVESAAQVHALNASIRAYAGRDVWLMVDQEGGRVQRMRSAHGMSDLPSMRDLGATADTSLAYDVGQILGSELAATGFNMALAPVLDVDTNPQNPVIADRALSNDPSVVAQMGLALIKGIQSQGVCACGKHFPGHGDTHVDSHVGLPRVPHDLQRLRDIEWQPFAACAQHMGAMMTAHVVCEQLDVHVPATMSAKVLARARQDITFDGLLVSDCMEMQAIAGSKEWGGVVGGCVAAVAAGVQQILISHHPLLAQQAIDALYTNTQQEARIADRLHAAVLANHKALHISQPACVPLSACGTFHWHGRQASNTSFYDPTEQDYAASD